MLNLEQAKKLIGLARNSIETYFSRREQKITKEIKAEFSTVMGVFVTLNKGNELRGCIGYPEPIMPLYEGIAKAARGAAFSDPRFPPLSKEEFGSTKIEISILTPPKLIEVRNPEDYIQKIKIGRDGLLVRGTFNSGLLLPQVAVEQKWNAQTFLEQTCVKAGLEPNIWYDFDNCRVYSFQGYVFSEQSPNGNVIRVL